MSIQSLAPFFNWVVCFAIKLYMSFLKKYVVDCNSAILQYGLPRWHGGKKNLPARAGDARDMGSIPGSEKPPGGVNDNPL